MPCANCDPALHQICNDRLRRPVLPLSRGSGAFAGVSAASQFGQEDRAVESAHDAPSGGILTMASEVATGPRKGTFPPRRSWLVRLLLTPLRPESRTRASGGGGHARSTTRG